MEWAKKLAVTGDRLEAKLLNIEALFFLFSQFSLFRLKYLSDYERHLKQEVNNQPLTIIIELISLPPFMSHPRRFSNTVILP